MIKILDIPFSTNSKKEILTQIEQFFDTQQQYQICTPNPEFLLESLRNPAFKKVLQNSVLNIPDGIGILWAATVEKAVLSIKYKVLREILKYPIGIFYLICIAIYPRANKNIIHGRITGTDLMKDIFEKFRGKKIFLLGAKEGVGEKAASKLASANVETGLKPVSTGRYNCFAGSPKPSDEPEIISKINKFNPDILFVAFGAPNQDLWIAKNLSKMPSVKFSIGVGGAFDFWAGEKKRAPKIFQILGIEWMFRLFIEPKRWKRIFNAVVVFPWRFLKNI